MSQFIWYCCSSAIVVYASILFIKWQWMRPSRLPYPPGPNGLPLIGNIRDIPPHSEWVAYEQWSHQYESSLIHLKLPGAHLIVINSIKVAFDLLEKRSAIYSDRPRLPMIRELICWNGFSASRYGPEWRSARRLFHQFFNINTSVNYQPQLARAAHELLYRLAHTPDDYREHVRLMAGSLILNITYGIDVRTIDDPFILMAEDSVQVMSKVANPGSFLVDTLPILKYVPEWFPGAGFKIKAKEWRKVMAVATTTPFHYVKAAMEKGVHTPSVASQALERCQGDEDLENVAQDVSGMAYIAGADTTITALITFILGMVLYPEVVHKAHEELDSVVGRDRLPNFADEPSLPYVRAIVREVLRWHPVSALGIVHRLVVDDVYDGMFLPEGSLVLANAWAMLRDAGVYKDPETFNPGRFLKDGKLDPDVRSPEVAAFGFGRRICPGRYLALGSLFLNIACILATFDIEKAIDDHGKPIIPKEEFTSGLFCIPLPFKCSIKTRSPKAFSIIAEACAMSH